jgi:hypothetical protein
MSNINITQLPSITQANLSGTDVLPVVDILDNTTKKVQVDQLITHIEQNANIVYAETSSVSTSSSYSQNSYNSIYSVSSSYATRAQSVDYINVVLRSDTASFALTASYVANAITSSYSLSASYLLPAATASYSNRSLTSSFSITSSYSQTSTTSSYSLTSSYSATASVALVTIGTATVANYAASAGTCTASIWSVQSGYATSSLTSSYALTASFVLTSSYSPYTLSSSYAGTSSYTLTCVTSATISDYATQAGIATSSLTASYLIPTATASYSLTSSYSFRSVTSSYSLYSLDGLNSSTASYLIPTATASYSLTSSYLMPTATASYSLTSSFANTELVSQILNIMYPIGTVYMTTQSSANWKPMIHGGFPGIWETRGDGRYIVGEGKCGGNLYLTSSVSVFGTNYSRSLAKENIPQHTHSFTNVSATGGQHSHSYWDTILSEEKTYADGWGVKVDDQKLRYFPSWAQNITPPTRASITTGLGSHGGIDYNNALIQQKDTSSINSSYSSFVLNGGTATNEGGISPVQGFSITPPAYVLTIWVRTS